MIGVHKYLKTWERMVALYVAVTAFARDKLIEGGLPAAKIVVKPNFVEHALAPGTGAGGYALFAGRLSSEKGLATVLAAWQRLGRAIPLKIVGDGPLADHVEATAAGEPAVEYLGRRPLPEVYELMRDARFLVFPSEWYEPFGRVAIEAFACGTPVIASAMGGMAELIDDGHTGCLFRPGDADDLARVVERVLDEPDELARMRRHARAEFEAKYTPERNYQQLMTIYRRALAPAAPSGAHEPCGARATWPSRP